MGEWVVIKIRKETKEELEKLRDEFYEKLNSENKQRLDIPIKVSFDMVIQRLYKFWYKL